MSNRFTFVANEFSPKEDIRNISDGLAIFYYMFAWFLIALTNVFADAITLFNHNFYFNFDIVSIFFIIIYYNHIRKNEVESDRGEIIKEFLNGTKWVIIFGIAFFGGWQVFWQIVPIPVYYVEGGISEGFNFQLFRSIPVEEMAFRGFGMFSIQLCTSWLLKFSMDYKNKTEVYSTEDINKIDQIVERISWGVALIITSLMFAIYHLPKYMSQYYPFYPVGTLDGYVVLASVWFPLVYLFILGVLCGLLRYRYGLLFAIMFHIANNLLAVVYGAM